MEANLVRRFKLVGHGFVPERKCEYSVHLCEFVGVHVFVRVRGGVW